MRLNGKIALITGASRGIGLGIVEVFAEQGATVIAASTSNPAGCYPEGVEGVELDVTNPAHWARAVADIIARHGRIDILVNNAGIIAMRRSASWASKPGTRSSRSTRPARSLACAK
jgi:NAD(P)-dependent dehydrogenase (short-subunit alcohol dehydrogenase family)